MVTTVIGAVFLMIRIFAIGLILAIYYGPHYLSTFFFKIYIISLVVGALIDLGLIIGSVMKNKILLLYIWIGAQFFVGKKNQR